MEFIKALKAVWMCLFHCCSTNELLCYDTRRKCVNETTATFPPRRHSAVTWIPLEATLGLEWVPEKIKYYILTTVVPIFLKKTTSIFFVHFPKMRRVTHTFLGQVLMNMEWTRRHCYTADTAVWIIGWSSKKKSSNWHGRHIRRHMNKVGVK